MLILRIRQAETALADGRQDEAFELARRDDFRAHRRGQKLVGRLARSLVERGRRHLEAERYQQAMTDCSKATELAGNLPEASELRQAVEEAISSRQVARRRLEDALAAAKSHAENGRLSFCDRVLDDLDDESCRARQLNGEVAVRRESAESALQRAEAAMVEEDWATAVDAVDRARNDHAGCNRLAEVTARLTKLVNQRVRETLEEGRLDLAELLLRRLVPLAGHVIETQELRRIVEQCHLACEQVRQAQSRQAAETLRRLAAVLPGAGWIQDALRSARQAMEGMEGLRGGPLGLLSPERTGAESPHADREPAGMDTAALPMDVSGPSSGARLPERFMIHVDGVGSYLVLADRRVSIGASGSSSRPELALMADPGLPKVAVERTDEDYFLSSSEPVRINGKSTARKLLADGDKINLSRRCRIRFGLPNPACTTATLDLSGTRLPNSDVRRVILLDRSIVLGPGATSHIRTDQLASPVVLSVRDGRLFCGGGETVTIDDRPVDRQAGVPLDARVCVGPVSFVVTTT